MKSGDAQFQSRLRLGMAMLAVTLCLSACTTVKSGWQSTKDAVSGVFSSDDKAQQTAEAEGTDAPAEAAPSAPAAPMTGGLFMGSGSASSAFQTSSGGLSSGAPAQAAAPAAEEKKAEEEKPAPKKASSKPPKKAPEPPKEEKKEEPKVDTANKADAKPAADTRRATEGLLADKTKAEYTEQGGRREPVTVRPLNETQTAEASAPPRPAAAPVEQVARLQGQLDAPSKTAPAPADATPAATASAKSAPSAADLADRLNAPAPTPGAGIPDAPRAPAPVTPAPVAGTPAPTAVASAPVQALIPSTPTYTPPTYTQPNNSTVGYGDDTVVVDSSGTRGGRNVLQSASASRNSFDPGNASVSSEVGTVVFAPNSANLSAQGKAILADAARLRVQVDGAIRIVGRGDQAAARAAAVSKELRRLGVPASRLYDGGADSTVLGDAADIYLDY